MEEPSILDYLKSKLAPWKGHRVEIPVIKPEEYGDIEPEPDPEQVLERGVIESEIEADYAPIIKTKAGAVALPFRLPWRAFVAITLVLFAQWSLAPGHRQWQTGIIIFILAAGWLAWAFHRGEFTLAPLPGAEQRFDPTFIRTTSFLVGIFLLLIAFLAFGGNQVTSLNLLLWSFSLALLIHALWLPSLSANQWLKRLWVFLGQPTWRPILRAQTLLVLGSIIVVLFFRFYNLEQVPPEMTSDHAEKLLDVADVLAGQTHIFFPRNAGREPLIMYLNAAVASVLGTGLSFATLKISTVLVGLSALPFIYLLGNEIGNRRVGFLALLLAGIAYWPNVVSRVGLRFSFYPLFTAITFFYLIRGIRTNNRNDFILAGVSLGLSFYGYTANRILPLVVVAAVGLYLIHVQSRGQRRQVIWHLTLLVLISFAVFVPLLRYVWDEPEAFAFRSLTRMGTLERPLPGPVWFIFVSNLWNALKMFSWEAGNVWLASIPNYPALGVVSGALFLTGSWLLLVRYMKDRLWVDLFLLLSIPLLMLPSVLSLAFPIENPNLYRTGGALIPVFLIAGLALDGLISSIKSHLAIPWGTRIAWGLVSFLFVWSGVQNYDLVFNKYYRQFLVSDWNYSEIGLVIRSYTNLSGNTDSTWVVPYPYWVDTRLVGIEAGYPGKDYALWPEQFQDTLDDPRAKLFILFPEDRASLDALRLLYPQGWSQIYTSRVSTKEFVMFFVPPTGNGSN